MIKLPIRISRKFVTEHPDWIFIYGNDYFQKGCLGQAWEFANEPNTFRVPTLYKYCANPVFFTDSNFDEWSYRIKCEIDVINVLDKPKIVVRKIGEGCSRMKELAPRLFEYMTNRLKQVATPTEIDYRWLYA